MSESPLFVPPYAPISRRVELPPSGGQLTPPEFDSEDEAPRTAGPIREGLPASYRMRAEPHYVEALARLRPEASLASPPPVSDTRAKVAANQAIATAAESLARALESINASLSEVRGQGRPLRERMLLELARAEAVRAGWLADAAAVLQSEPLPRLDQVSLRDVVTRVTSALGPEQRVTGQSPSVEMPDVSLMVFGDDRLLTVAVGAMVQALCAMIDGHDHAAVTVRAASLRDGRTRGVEVSQSVVRVSSAIVGRLFDTDWPEHPGGATAAVLLAGARRIAALQGGALEAQPLDTGGCRLVVWLPAADAS